MKLVTVSLDPPTVTYTVDDQPMIYRVGNVRFACVVDAEKYKLDEPDYRKSRLPIELWYKDRWHVMGDIPMPLRRALA